MHTLYLKIKSADAWAVFDQIDQIIGMESENLWESQKNYALALTGLEWSDLV
jgi:hypothetical protein